MKPFTCDISTTYLGLPLRSPLVIGASPLSKQIENLQELEAVGAPAVVLHSLFEEPWQPDPDNVRDYMRHITLARSRVGIPVIASLNATTTQGWADLARLIETAGASALELNIYQMTISTTTSASQVEDRYLEAVQAVTAAVKIPVAVKMPPTFTNLAYMAKKVELAGAKGLVLFNRFYQPDFDLNVMGIGKSLRLSTSTENRLPRRWISILFRPIRIDLIANTGIREGDDVLKMILSGAAATQICAVILQRGISWVKSLESELKQVMENCRITSLKEVRGQFAHDYAHEAGVIEREEYQTALQGYYRFNPPTARSATGPRDFEGSES